jgi:hypothetical protein
MEKRKIEITYPIEYAGGKSYQRRVYIDLFKTELGRTTLIIHATGAFKADYYRCWEAWACRPTMDLGDDQNYIDKYDRLVRQYKSRYGAEVVKEVK